MSDTNLGHSDTVLTTASQNYLLARGHADTTAGWADGIGGAMSRLNLGLSHGQPFTKEDVMFVVDWHNDNYDPSDDANGTSFDDLRKYYFTNIDLSGNGTTRVRRYLDGGKTITDDLAPLFLDARFFASVADRNAYIAASMYNHVNNPASNQAPSVDLVKAFLSPADSISTLHWTLDSRIADVPVSAWPPGTTTTVAARTTVEAWIEKLLKGEAEPGSTLDPELLKVYFDSDPQASTDWIGAALESYIAAPGPVSATAYTLLDAYRGLNLKGPDGPVRDPATLDKSFDPAGPPQPIAGWMSLALDLVEKLAREGLPPQPAILAKLDEVHPWAGAYARYSALRQQIERGQNLNTGYLASLAAFSPRAAGDLCELQLKDSYKTTSVLLTAAGVPATVAVTKNTSPTIRVYLSSLGTPRPKEGDTVNLWSNNIALVGTRAVSALDVSRGFIDVTTTAPLTDGEHKLTTTLQRSGTPLPPESLPTPPLTVSVDTTAPQLSGGEYSGNRVVLQFSTGFGGFADFAPAGIELQVRVTPLSGGPYNVNVNDVVVDAKTGRLVLNLAQALPADYGRLEISYTPTPQIYTQLQDVAGNKVGYFSLVNPPYLSYIPPITSTSAVVPSLSPARAMDHGAMDMLKMLRPDAASRWLDLFTSANLIGPPPPPPPPPPAPPPPPPKKFSEMTPDEQDKLALQVLVKECYGERYTLIEKMVRDQMEKIQLQNTFVSRLSDLRRVLSSLQVDTNGGTDQQKMNEILPDATEAGWTTKIREAEALLPGLQLFSQTANEAAPNTGRFNISLVTKRGLADAIDAIAKKIEAASGDQSLFMTDLQSYMGKASDASSTMSSILKRLHESNEAIIRNL